MYQDGFKAVKESYKRTIVPGPNALGYEWQQLAHK